MMGHVEASNACEKVFRTGLRDLLRDITDSDEFEAMQAVYSGSYGDQKFASFLSTIWNEEMVTLIEGGG